MPQAPESPPAPADTGPAAPRCAAVPGPYTPDAWGGDARVTWSATGFFRTESRCDRWWLVTPDGHPFVSTGVNAINPSQGPGQETGVDRYAASVAAIYPDNAAWVTATGDRLIDWGFRTVGAWSSHDALRGVGGLSQAINLRISGGDWLTGDVADWFSPAWEAHVRAGVDAQVTPWVGDPSVLGWFIDNETRWGPDWRGTETLLQLYLNLPAEAPGKQEAVRWLLAQTGGIAGLNARFGLDLTDEADALARQDGWAVLATGALDADGAHAADALTSGWLTHAADRYFGFTTDAIRSADPDHLVLGNRDVSVMTRAEVFDAAARHVDVISINNYRFLPGVAEVAMHLSAALDPADGFAALHARADLPVLITEFSFRSDESDVPNTWPPTYPVYATQAERAEALADYAAFHQQIPWIVGYHWFEWCDEPADGRFDGEDSNFGLVNAADAPYGALTDQMRASNLAWYEQIRVETAGL